MVLGHDVLTSERTRDIKISEDVSFETMLLAPNTLEGLKASGFHIPSPIQLHGIPLGKCGFDLLLEAKSGTGKTAVFSVIALEKLNLGKGVQTLILAPTREIASQISDVIKTIGANFKGLAVEVVMGGLPFAEDVEKLKKNVHIIVGSPGRVHHLIKEKHINVSSVRLMVLDEADKLVEKSFLPDINYIFSQLPSQKQIIMSSATYPTGIKTLMSKYVQNAHHICPDSSSILLGIEQNVEVVPHHVNIVKQTKNRYDELNKILSKKKFKQCIVFCNYQVRVGEVHKMLTKDKWPADKLHGQQQQIVRLEALKVLQEYQCRILVTTDLTARGIDASNVDLVINFEIPYDWQTYLHRIGRAGRFGSYGNAITILSKGEEEIKFKKLVDSVNIPFHINYLWSKEPFELDNQKKSSKTVIHEEIPQPKVIEQEKQLGVKETYNELWKMLSVDSVQHNKENLDIPTFESLCKSFDEVNTDSKRDHIESFSDLMSSFQNHEIKTNVYTCYTPINVNRLIKPSTIFNRSIVLQSVTKAEPVVEPDNNENYYHNSNTDINQENTISSQSNNLKYEQICVSENTDSSESIDNNIKVKLKEKLSHSKHRGNNIKDNSLENHDTLTTTVSSEYKEYSANNFKLNENSSSMSKQFDTVHIPKPKTTCPTFRDENQKSVDDPDPILTKPVENASSHYGSDNIVTCTNNKYEKLLHEANLPTAFGKQKNKKPIHRDVPSKQYYRDKQNITDIQYQTQSKIKTRLNIKKIVFESSDEEESEEETDSCQSQSFKNHISSSCGQRQNYVLYNSIAEQRQHQLNVWYQQLRKHMLMIEQSVYITQMRNL